MQQMRIDKGSDVSGWTKALSDVTKVNWPKIALKQR